MAREPGGFWIYVWIWDFGRVVFGVGGGGMVAIPGAVGSDISDFIRGNTDTGDDAAADSGAAICDRVFSGDCGVGRAGVGDAGAEERGGW